MKKTPTSTLALATTLILAPWFAEMAHAQSTGFTYQGRLEGACEAGRPGTARVRPWRGGATKDGADVVGDMDLAAFAGFKTRLAG